MLTDLRFGMTACLLGTATTGWVATLDFMILAAAKMLQLPAWALTSRLTQQSVVQRSLLVS